MKRPRIQIKDLFEYVKVPRSVFRGTRSWEYEGRWVLNRNLLPSDLTVSSLQLGVAGISRVDWQEAMRMSATKEQMLELADVFSHLSEFYSTEAKKLGRPKSKELDEIVKYIKDEGKWLKGRIPWSGIFKKFAIEETRRGGIRSGIRTRRTKALNNSK